MGGEAKLTGHADNDHAVCFFIAPVQTGDIGDFTSEFDRLERIVRIEGMTNRQDTLQIETVFSQSARLINETRLSREREKE